MEQPASPATAASAASAAAQQPVSAAQSILEGRFESQLADAVALITRINKASEASENLARAARVFSTMETGIAQAQKNIQKIQETINTIHPQTELISGRLQRAEQARKLMVPDARLQPAPLKEDTRTTDSEEAF